MAPLDTNVQWGLVAMSFLRNLREEGVEIKLQVSKRSVVIGGRRYDVPHIIVVGLKEMTLKISREDLMLEGGFNEIPHIERPAPGVVKASISGKGLPKEFFALPSFEKEEFFLSNMTLMFEEDKSNRVIIRLEDGDSIGLNGLKVISKVPTSLNMILSPYTIGTLWFWGPLKVFLKESRKLFELIVIPT